MTRPRAYPPAFWLAALPLIGFAFMMLVAPGVTQARVASAFTQVTQVLGRPWQMGVVIYTLVALAVALSPLGGVRVGTEEEPEMSWPAWIAIIVCTLLAGGGVFWSAAEPLYHFQTPSPAYAELSAATEEAAVAALAQSHFHWGTLAWCVVGTLGVAAYTASQRLYGEPLRPRALVSVLVGGPLPEWLGTIIDGVSIIAVVAGTVGPIGFLALQLSYAGDALIGVPEGLASRLGVLGALVLVYTVSAATGLHRGIAWLSRLNVGLALVFGTAVVLLGDPQLVASLFARSMTAYAADAGTMALGTADASWLSGWTWFYWGWFIGYGPLMALFVTRISRGRRLRAVILGVGLVAPLLTHVWFAALGGTGLGLELNEPGVITGPLAEHGLAAALLAIVGSLPGAAILSAAAVVLVFCFLATTGDSMAYTISVVLTGESTPPVRQRVFWGASMGMLAALLVTVGGDAIDALQRFIAITAAPVSLLMALTIVAGPLGAWRLWRADLDV